MFNSEENHSRNMNITNQNMTDATGSNGVLRRIDIPVSSSSSSSHNIQNYNTQHPLQRINSLGSITPFNRTRNGTPLINSHTSTSNISITSNQDVSSSSEVSDLSASPSSASSSASVATSSFGVFTTDNNGEEISRKNTKSSRTHTPLSAAIYKTKSSLSEFAKKNSTFHVGSHSSLIIEHRDDDYDNGDEEYADDDIDQERKKTSHLGDKTDKQRDESLENESSFIQDTSFENQVEKTNVILGYDKNVNLIRKESISDEKLRPVFKKGRDNDVLYGATIESEEEEEHDKNILNAEFNDNHDGEIKLSENAIMHKEDGIANEAQKERDFKRKHLSVSSDLQNIQDKKRVSNLSLSFSACSVPSSTSPSHSVHSADTIIRVDGVPILINEQQSERYIAEYLQKHKSKFQVYKRVESAENGSLMEIADFSTESLLSMLACLLDKIITSNDEMVRVMKESSPTENDSSLIPNLNSDNTTDNHNNGNMNYDMSYNSRNPSVLHFRGKTVPKISLEEYLQRIYKFCPTSNDVFISLLVYFDRITKKFEKIGEKFIMDSFNIHRLIIATITVSTKFFSDFYYTNSRYAKVGGLSLQELNNLELQILILCNFELIISKEDLQRYGDLLYKFCSK